MRRLALLLVSLAAACTTGEMAVTEIEVTPIETSGWAGAEIRLVSTAFADSASLPSITVGQETLAVRLVAPETAAVRLPNAGGLRTLSLAFPGGASAEVASIRVYGLLSVGDGPLLDGRLVPIAGQGNPTVVGIAAGGRLARADLQTLAIAPLGSPSDTGYQICMRGIVPSAQDPQIVTVARYSLGCRVRAVRLDNPLTIVDTGSVMAIGYTAVYLGPGRWIVSLKTTLASQVAGVTTSSEHCVEAGGFLNAGVITMPLWCFHDTGVPVFDKTTGSLRGRVPMQYVGDAAASPSGDTVFVVGFGSYLVDSTLTLMVVDGRTGDSLHATRMAPASVDRHTLAVAIDPIGPWLYVAGGYYGPAGAKDDVWLRIYDRRTLAQVGEAKLPERLDYQQSNFSLVVGADRVLYLLAGSIGFVPPEPTTMYRFSLPPN